MAVPTRFHLLPERISLFSNRCFIPKVNISTIINSKVTGLKITNFLHDVEESSLLLVWTSVLQYSNRFWNASATNEGE